MSKNFNLTLLPLYRLRGNELPSPPGLLALTPPRRKARSRANDLLIAHLSLSGNASLSTANYHQITAHAAEEFYKTAGSVTAALRAAAIMLNGDLLEHNMAASGQGRYSLTTLVLGAVRGEQIYLLESGPAHAYWMSGAERRDIHDSEMAGRGLGLGQSTQFYLSQLPLHTGGRLLIAPDLPAGWMPILQRDNQSASLETLRSVLMRQNMEDQNAVLVEFQDGRGGVEIIKPQRVIKPTLESISQKIAEEPSFASHSPEPHPVAVSFAEDVPVAAPSLYNESKPPQERSVTDSIPRKIPESPPPPVEIEIEEEKIPTGPPISEVIARESARTLARGMQATRKGNNHLKDLFSTMLPRLLPSSDSETPVHLPNWVMILIAVIIPLIVVTISSVVYFRFGHDVQYENYFAEAQILRAHALEKDDPVAQRIAWQDTLSKLDQAEEYDLTPASRELRDETENHLDLLLGVIRLDFQPAVVNLPSSINISAMAATDTELFMLDSVKGEILRAYRTDKGYQYDGNFSCKSGDYGENTLGALVKLQALSTSNAVSASVLGIDKDGNLLYCAANSVPQAMSLLQPSVGFKEITDIVLEDGVLYLLDAPSHEVWIYSGQASTFNSYPRAFFTNAPQGIEYARDMSVEGGDLYLLFSDGHLASCTSSLLDTVPTRCINPAELSNQHLAAGGGDNFGASLFSQIYISTSPGAALLLLAPETQSVFSFLPRSFVMQNELRPATNSLPSGTLSAMTVNSGHVLFVAQGDQVYMATDMP